MTEEPPRLMTASRWLLSGVMTLSLIFGAVGGLAVLFIGDTFFDKTPDPAVNMVEVREEFARTQQRLQELEKKLEEAPTQSVAPESDTAAIEAEVNALKEQIATMQPAAQENPIIGQALLGI